jgi:hypothetical protein
MNAMTTPPSWKSDPRFTVKVALGAAGLPFLVVVLALWRQEILAFFATAFIPILFPVLYLVPSKIEESFIYLAFGVYSPFSLLAASVLWFCFGLAVGRATRAWSQRAVKATVILLSFSVLYTGSGYGLMTVLEERSRPFEAARQQEYAERIQQARLKIWCTEEIGTLTLYADDGLKEWAFRGVAEAVRVCDGRYVVSEARTLPDAVDFHMSHPGQRFLGACRAGDGAAACDAYGDCG